MKRPTFRLLLPIILSLLLTGTALPAQDSEQTGSIDAQRKDGLVEYERISREMSLSSEKLARLAAEIATVKKDSVALTAALIQSAKTEKKLSGDILEIEDRMTVLKMQESSARASLVARRDVLANVLGALERMGLNPPPALLVQPEDALSSVRSAILLGAVVPELRGQTETLLADLQKLSRLAASISAERDGLKEAISAQLIEKRRLDILVTEKKAARRDNEAALAKERKRAVELAGEAKSLKDLVAKLEAEARTARPQVPRNAPEETLPEQAALQLPDANLLMGPAPFDSLQRQLETPVPGRFVKRFGASDDNGGVMLGDTVGTQSDAIVTAPADGDVLYAGPFRSYGQLLILNVGSGYHVVLAGMNRINVAAGQSVLAGEPVGAMGDARVASAAETGVGTTGQELYIEFRKDGKSVDPAPWWARRLSGRTGNDT